MEEQTRNQVGRALGKIPSGGSVLTARHGERCTGMLISWVQQASFEPPAITVAVRHGRPIEELIQASGHFVLNLIGEERGPMFKHFSRGFGPDEPAFHGLAIREIPQGIVLEECLAHLACRVIGSIDAGDHRVYVGEVVDGGLQVDGKPYVHLRSNGFRY